MKKCLNSIFSDMNIFLEQKFPIHDASLQDMNDHNYFFMPCVARSKLCLALSRFQHLLTEDWWRKAVSNLPISLLLVSAKLSKPSFLIIEKFQLFFLILLISIKITCYLYVMLLTESFCRNILPQVFSSYMRRLTIMHCHREILI